MAFSVDYKRTVKGRAVSLLSNARKRCKEKEIELHLTQEWVEEHLVRGTCEITGLHFCFEPPDQKATRRWDAPSLDRIDKDKHYTKENTRVILWAVNCALAEYGTKIMLPILKAMVKGIESANKKTITPLPTGIDNQGVDNTTTGLVSTAGTREDSYDLDHYRRTVSGEDSDYRTQTRGGDSVGYGGQQVGTPQAPEGEQDNWQLHPTYGWIER
jgi:hypothetical protein